MFTSDFFHFVSKNEVTGYISWALFFRMILASSTGKNQLQNLRYQSEYQILSAECTELIPHILNNFQRDLVKNISSYVAKLHARWSILAPQGPVEEAKGSLQKRAWSAWDRWLNPQVQGVGAPTLTAGSLRLHGRSLQRSRSNQMRMEPDPGGISGVKQDKGWRDDWEP